MTQNIVQNIVPSFTDMTVPICSSQSSSPISDLSPEIVVIVLRKIFDHNCLSEIFKGSPISKHQYEVLKDDWILGNTESLQRGLDNLMTNHHCPEVDKVVTLIKSRFSFANSSKNIRAIDHGDRIDIVFSSINQFNNLFKK